jgi:hypothetical protein
MSRVRRIAFAFVLLGALSACRDINLGYRPADFATDAQAVSDLAGADLAGADLAGQPDLPPAWSDAGGACNLPKMVASCTDDTACAPYGAICFAPGGDCVICGTCQCMTHCGSSYCNSTEICVHPCSGIQVDAAALSPYCSPRPAVCTSGGGQGTCNCGGVCPSGTCTVAGDDVTCNLCA